MSYDRQAVNVDYATVDIFPGSLADTAAVQSSEMANSKQRMPYARIGLQLDTDGTPAASGNIEIYLFRDVQGVRDDDFGVNAGAITVRDATLIGVIPTDATPRPYYKTMQVLLGGMTDKFAIGIKNNTGNALGVDSSVTCELYSLE